MEREVVRKWGIGLFVIIMLVVIGPEVVNYFFGVRTEADADWSHCSDDTDCFLVRERCGMNVVSRSGIHRYEYAFNHAHAPHSGLIESLTCADPFLGERIYLSPAKAEAAGYGVVSCRAGFCKNDRTR